MREHILNKKIERDAFTYQSIAEESNEDDESEENRNNNGDDFLDQLKRMRLWKRVQTVTVHAFSDVGTEGAEVTQVP